MSDTLLWVGAGAAALYFLVLRKPQSPDGGAGGYPIFGNGGGGGGGGDLPLPFYPASPLPTGDPTAGQGTVRPGGSSPTTSAPPPPGAQPARPRTIVPPLPPGQTPPFNPNAPPSMPFPGTVPVVTPSVRVNIGARLGPGAGTSPIPQVGSSGGNPSPVVTPSVRLSGGFLRGSR